MSFAEGFSDYINYSVKRRLAPVTRNVFSREMKFVFKDELDEGRIVIKKRKKLTFSGIKLLKEDLN